MVKAKKAKKDPHPDVKKVLDYRNDLLAKAKTDAEKTAIHEDCKGLFGCPKQATDKEKEACYENIMKKLKAHESKAKKGGRSRARSKSRRRSRSRSKSKK